MYLDEKELAEKVKEGVVLSENRAEEFLREKYPEKKKEKKNKGQK